MILAGVLLKLGGYGLIRSLFYLGGIFLVIGLLGGVYRGLICLCQRDLKSLIAYSSIVHIGILIRGLISLNNFGVEGGILIIVGHAFCSSSLFYFTGLCYKLVGSRRFFLLKGVRRGIVNLKYLWFFIIVGNISAPPTFNLFSEIYLLISILMYSFVFIYILIIFSFLSSLYNLYLYRVMHGRFSFVGFSWEKSDIGGYLNIIIHRGFIIFPLLKIYLFFSLNSLKRI